MHQKKVSYYSADTMKSLLLSYPQYKEKLYCRGFLVTDTDLDLEDYPFYGNWQIKTVQLAGNCINIYTHKLIESYIYESDKMICFLIGHAYNPFTMQYQEMEILADLSRSWNLGKEVFWKKESELTGVFCLGILTADGLQFSTDCTGMQLIYYTQYKKHLYLTSHSKLVADLCGFQQDDYIVRLVNSKFYHYFGTWLPGDKSPFRELKRVQPNFATTFSFSNCQFSIERYYPLERIVEITDDKYDEYIGKIADILAKTMKLIALKWPNRRAAISVTGGRDSTTTLASAKDAYDQFGYFSYISQESERVDAEAAHKICDYLGLDHTIYNIPDESNLYKDIDVIKMILECNAGCIGHNNLNDVKKRIFLDHVDDFDVEVKSWVNELGRGWPQNKYNTKRFPAYPTPGYFRCMWKVILNFRLIRESNKIFSDYLNKYYQGDTFKYISWMDLYCWEFSWGGGEGIFLTSEHKYSYDITVPYNNRLLLNTMFQIPLSKRIDDRIPIDVIKYNNKKVEEAQIHVHNIAHTKMWSFILRTYLRIFSKI